MPTKKHFQTLQTPYTADPAARFITTSFLGLFMDICIMQPGRVVVVAFIMVILHTDICQ
jgi:hypothetical protein